MAYLNFTPEYAQYGPRKPNGELGTGMPWDWWENGKALIKAMKRPAD